MIPIIARLMIAAGMGAASYLFVKEGGVDRIKNLLSKDTDEGALKMVHDPNCDTYFPKGDAIRRWVAGERHHFCSTGCYEEYRVRNPD